VQRRHLVLALAVSACAANQDAETTFDPCSPITIAVDSQHPEDLAVVQAALAEWRQVLPVEATAVAAPPTSGQLAVRFLDGTQPIRGIYWDAIGVVEISRDELVPAAYPIAVAHELGHAFGLAHVDAKDRASVMNVSNTDIAPTPEDGAGVIAKWPSCRDTP
jgi:hypothetical protein